MGGTFTGKRPIYIFQAILLQLLIQYAKQIDSSKNKTLK